MRPTKFASKQRPNTTLGLQIYSCTVLEAVPDDCEDMEDDVQARLSNKVGNCARAARDQNGNRRPS